MHIISAADFPLYSAQILLKNALFCRQNYRLKNRLIFCSKFCWQNLSKPTRHLVCQCEKIKVDEGEITSLSSDRFLFCYTSIFPILQLGSGYL